MNKNIEDFDLDGILGDSFSETPKSEKTIDNSALDDLDDFMLIKKPKKQTQLSQIDDPNNFLELLFVQYKHLLSDPDIVPHKSIHSNPAFYDELGQPNDLSHNLFRFACEASFDSTFPYVVPDKNYSKIKSPEYYHSFRDDDYPAEFIADHRRHYGIGHDHDGFYITPDSDVFKSYSTKNASEKPKPERMMTCKLDTANIISHNDFHSDYARCVASMASDPTFYESHKAELPEKFGEIQNFFIKHSSDPLAKQFLSDLAEDCESVLAIFFGFDAVFHNGENYCVFDQRKILISETEANRLFELSHNHKNTTGNVTEKFNELQ